MNCTHCDNEPKYKCPVCRTPYCSVTCYKIHKQNRCSQHAEPPNELKCYSNQNRNYEYPTEDTVPQEKLKLLEQSPEVKECLKNPHVRKILELLDQSIQPDEMIQEYMQEPLFVEFVDACLKVVQVQKDT